MAEETALAVGAKSTIRVSGFGFRGSGFSPNSESRIPNPAAETAALPPWRLPARGLAVFHGAGNIPRLSHYFLPRLLMEGKRVLFLDGANSADPRLLERFARERNVPFERFNRGIQIARAFTCFQLTELIARVPKFLADFPAQVVIVTAFPDLYFDEDVRDWNARVAFEQGLKNLNLVASPFRAAPAGMKPGATSLRVSEFGVRVSGFFPNPQSRIPNPVAIAVFSAIEDFAPIRSGRRQFFSRLCTAASEVWRFSLDAENRLRLIAERRLPSPGPVRRLTDVSTLSQRERVR